MKTCTHCGKSVNSNHYCNSLNQYVDYNSTSDFLMSAVIGGMTDNCLLGGLLGGDIVGGIVGDLFSDGDLF